MATVVHAAAPVAGEALRALGLTACLEFRPSLLPLQLLLLPLLLMMPGHDTERALLRPAQRQRQGWWARPRCWLGSTGVQSSAVAACWGWRGGLKRCTSSSPGSSASTGAGRSWQPGAHFSSGSCLWARCPGAYPARAAFVRWCTGHAAVFAPRVRHRRGGTAPPVCPGEERSGCC